MNERIKDLFNSAENPEEVIRIAKRNGFDVELKNNKELNEDDLESVFGGARYLRENYASYSVVVRDKKTGAILCVVPY